MTREIHDDGSEDATRLAQRIRVNQQKLASEIRRSYDYIVCGTGSSGSVVAGRLAENPDITLLVLEAGGSDDAETVMDPTQWATVLGSDLHWNFLAEPSAHLNGRAIPYSMGKVLGGGSSVNVCTWSRGHRADWDYYAKETGDPAWNYESVLTLYNRIEDWHGTADARYRGAGGPVYLRPAQNPHVFFAALLEGAQSCGIPRFEHPNGRMMEAERGCSFVDEIVRGQKRQSIFRSYVYPRMDRANLTVLTGALVTRIVFQGTRAVGVEFRYGEQSLRVDATREVVLSLGAIQTPKVLMQSGIGDESELARFGIPLVQHLPGVGRNLHDHIALGCIWESSETAMPTAPRGQAVCFWKSRADLDAPNLFVYSSPRVFATPENAARFSLPEAAWSLSLGMRSASRGAIYLTGPDPSDPLRIQAGYLDDSRDLKDIRDGLAMCRDIGNSAALKPFAKREAVPGDLSDAAIEQFIRNGLVTFWHQSGTARMGRDAMSVVDSKLKVNGVERLRIADGSVMPRVTTGNTMAPCVVIGEQAAAFLQQEDPSWTSRAALR